MRHPLTATIILSPFRAITVTASSVTNPSSPIRWRISSLPHIFRTRNVSPGCAVVNGTIASPPPSSE